MTLRLGVARALVDATIVEGDVEVDPGDGTVVSVGLGGAEGSGIAVPGLVDLQVNGFAGVDLRSADPDGYRCVAAALAARGVTAVQPTFHSQSVDEHLRSLAVLTEVLEWPPPGCRFLAAHLEGPFLSPRRRGAHDVAHLLPVTRSVAERLVAGGPVGFMTIAPELDGALELIDDLAGRGVVMSVGHSDADAAVVHAAVRAGARHLTHCWNATRPPTARDPGPVGVALSTGSMVIGLIADLAHVSAEVVRITLQAAPGRVAATADAIAVAGTVDPTTMPGERVLVGGVAAPDDCLRNLVASGLTLAGAVDACGGVQRRLLGLPSVRLMPGEPADLVVLDDELRPYRTVIAGTVVTPA